MKIKRFIAFFITFIMIITILPAAAFAEEEYNTGEEVSAVVDGEETLPEETVSFAESLYEEDTDYTVENDTNGEAFYRQRTVSDEINISIEAPEGVFPSDAEFIVETVPEEDQIGIDKAIGEIRDENRTVALSYTYEIKVLIVSETMDMCAANSSFTGILCRIFLRKYIELKQP